MVFDYYLIIVFNVHTMHEVAVDTDAPPGKIFSDFFLTSRYDEPPIEDFDLSGSWQWWSQIQNRQDALSLCVRIVRGLDLEALENNTIRLLTKDPKVLKQSIAHVKPVRRRVMVASDVIRCTAAEGPEREVIETFVAPVSKLVGQFKDAAGNPRAKVARKSGLLHVMLGQSVEGLPAPLVNDTAAALIARREMIKRAQLFLSEKEIPSDDIHTARKALRALSHYSLVQYVVENEGNDANDALRRCSSLEWLSSSLGTFHERYEEKTYGTNDLPEKLADPVRMVCATAL